MNTGNQLGRNDNCSGNDSDGLELGWLEWGRGGENGHIQNIMLKVRLTALVNGLM